MEIKTSRPITKEEKLLTENFIKDNRDYFDKEYPQFEGYDESSVFFAIFTVYNHFILGNTFTIELGYGNDKYPVKLKQFIENELGLKFL